MSNGLRRHHSADFKASAVDLVDGQGYGAAETARRLGISRTMLDRWRREHRERNASAAAPGGDAGAADSELRRLREENRRLREEREILKKAAAFFANESN